MFEIVNRTPFAVSLIPGMGKDDVANLTVVAKGTFALGGSPGEPTIADEQVPFLPGDVWNGPDPAESSVRFESDACPAKPATDVVLVGHAHAGARPVRTVDVALRIGSVHKIIRVMGDRQWVRDGTGWVMSSPPAPFERMPLIYERAFGGVDRSDPDPGRHKGEDRNPVGTGFVASGRSRTLDGLPLPNLEDPGKLIRDWSDRPPISGFGFVARGWLPRRSLGGTYDERWTRERSPLLPEDFDDRFFNGAPADQVVRPHLRGGEPVSVSGCTPDGVMSFEVPRGGPSFTVDWAGGPREQKIAHVLDTLIIDPDERRIVICWRGTFVCGRRLRQVQRIAVRLAKGQ
jgi:hypothetical protein